MDRPNVANVGKEVPDRKSCWVCFASEDDDLEATWVRPCRCKGTTKWVHQMCLQRWIDEKQRGNSATKVSCPQCNTEYIIVFPSLGSFVYVMDVTDHVIYRVCPFVAAGIVVGSIYWTAVTYGAVTVMQVLGHKEGLSVMEQADPLFLLIGLPTIPIFLVLSKMIHWEDYVLRLWRQHSPKIPLIKYLYPQSNRIRIMEQDRIPMEPQPLTDPISATRVLCGALMLPTIATLFGKLLFDNVQSNLQRTLMGGIAFITIKGALKTYYKHHKYIQQVHRSILDFDEVSNTGSPDVSSDHD